MVNKLRNILSIEEDEYFLDETLIYYINKAEEHIVSYFIARERAEALSFRALDSLRSVQNIQVSLTNNNGLFIGTLQLPNDLQQYDSLFLGTTTVLREINGSNRFKLIMGNMEPSSIESYFQVLNNNNVQIIASSQNPDTVNIYYKKKRTQYDVDTEELSNLPVYLENAVLYYAAFLAVTQENVAEMEKNAQDFFSTYQNEIQAGSY
jgi:aspartokinase